MDLQLWAETVLVIIIEKLILPVGAISATFSFSHYRVIHKGQSKALVRLQRPRWQEKYWLWSQHLGSQFLDE